MITAEILAERLALADQLLLEGLPMLNPQDLPGRYGRVVQALDRVLGSMNCPAVVAGGWAVQRHGYVGRVTQDIDVVVPASRVEELVRVAVVAGFEALPVRPGSWPKLQHKETGVRVGLMPEGGRHGTAIRPAPTTIPSPQQLGATGAALRYADLPGLIELRLAASRARDKSDVVELIRANPTQLGRIRQHLEGVHLQYAAAFDELVARAEDC